MSVVTRQWVVPVGAPEPRQWQVHLVGYSYELYRDDAELLLYHWHPQGSSHLVEPHLHLGPSLLAAIGTKRALHLPTGEIRLAAFVTMLIREFGVRARRRDWQAILDSADV